MWRIFGPWSNERECEWRKIYNEVLNDLYYSPKIFRLLKLRRIKWAVRVACMCDWRVLCMVLVEKPEGNFPLGRPKHTRENVIKMDFKDVRCSGMT
jgi:hypothetical protein